MAESNYVKREHDVSRFIHHLFWKAATLNKFYFCVAAIFFPPTFILLNLYIPYEVALGIKHVFEKNYDLVAGSAIQLSIAFLICTMLNAIAIYGMNRINFDYLLSKSFKNFLSKDYQFYTDSFVGSLGSQLSQLRDAYTLYTGIFIIQGSKNAVIILGGLGVIAFQSPGLALISLATIALILGYLFSTGKFRLKYRQIVSSASNNLSGVMTDSLSQGATVKAMGSEEYEMKNMRTPIKSLERLQTKSWDLYIPTQVGRFLLNGLAVVVLLLASAKLYIAGQISIEIVVLVQLYMIRIIAATQDVYEQLKLYEQAMGLAYEPAKTMMIGSKVSDPLEPKKVSKDPGEILLKNISFSYQKTIPRYVVKDFDIKIKKGEKVGLVGYSGSGKTTLTKLILRFMDVNKGSIEIDGVDVRNMKQKDLRKLISYVPQEPLLFHRSIYENIAYGDPSAKKLQIESAAKLAYVSEFANELAQGMETIVGERGIKLSGGQRQRVAIARAILKNSPILVLDEATSALDSKSEKLIQDALLKLIEGRTAFVIAHRLSTVQRMDRIIVMDKGRIVQQGSHKELVKKRGIYRELWSHQSGGYLGGLSD